MQRADVERRTGGGLEIDRAAHRFECRGEDGLAAALVGAPAVVLQRVDADGGLVRIGGEDWSARAYVPDQVLEPGAKVEVAEISGATALVYE